MDANIIVTIGEEAIKSNPEMVIEKMIDYDVTYFRFNLSRYQSINDFEDHVNIIKRIRKCFENKIQIIKSIVLKSIPIMPVQTLNYIEW